MEMLPKDHSTATTISYSGVDFVVLRGSGTNEGVEETTTDEHGTVGEWDGRHRAEMILSSRCWCWLMMEWRDWSSRVAR